MKKIKVLILLLLAFFIGEGQMVITGKIINKPIKEHLNETYIHYIEPINGYSNIFLGEKRSPIRKDHSFKITKELKKEGFVYVKLPGKSLWLFVQPNDTLFFEATFTSDKQQGKYLFSDISFRGKNAAGHKAFNVNPWDVTIQNYLLKNLFNQKCATPQQFHENMLFTLKRMLDPFDSLYQRKAIDTVYYNAVSADIKGKFGSEIINLYGIMLNFKDKKPTGNKFHQAIYDALAVNKDVFTKKDLDTIKHLLYSRIDPLDEDINYSFLAKQYTSDYCQDIQSGLIQAALPYDSAFSNFKSIEHYGYLKGRFLENLWCSYLYWAASTESDGKVLDTGLKMFASYFPTSSFLPYLKERLGAAIQDRGLNEEITGGVKIVSNNSYGSLQQLAKENFQGNYVFVDLWATWCAPCLFDFTYKNGLKVFLQEKGIQALYVSIDKESDRSRWQAFISRNELNGYHFLASDSLVQDIQRKLYNGEEVMIPRYVLLNREGIMIATDLPRPSDMEALKKEINRLLEEEQKHTSSANMQRP